MSVQNDFARQALQAQSCQSVTELCMMDLRGLENSGRQALQYPLLVGKTYEHAGRQRRHVNFRTATFS